MNLNLKLSPSNLHLQKNNFHRLDEKKTKQNSFISLIHSFRGKKVLKRYGGKRVQI